MSLLLGCGQDHHKEPWEFKNMSTNLTTLGQDWAGQYVSAMSLMHRISNYETRIKPRQPPTADILVEMLNKIVGGQYVPANYFAEGGSLQPAVHTAPPQIAEGARYSLISLNAETTRSEFTSTQTGGIIFEDPVWAVLAAQALATKRLVGVPLAQDNDHLWKNVARAAADIEGRAYQPEHFLAPVVGFIPPAASWRFDLVTVESEQLLALRKRGTQALRVAVPPRFFELFQPPATSPDRVK